jgi:hypothetical protein
MNLHIKDLSNIISEQGPSMRALHIMPTGTAKVIGYKFGILTDRLAIYIALPHINGLQFHRTHFLKFMAGSISLSKEEKRTILCNIHQLSQIQMDALIQILEEERAKFRKLDDTHLNALMELEMRSLIEWREIEAELLGI